MSSKRHLTIFANPDQAVEESVPRPTPDQVLYSPANTNGTRKLCQNCIFWAASDEQCVIHKPDVIVPPDAVCGYHVFGKPIYGTYVQHDDMEPVDPELSGLVQISGGTSCDKCKNYRRVSETYGRCVAVRDFDSDSDAIVENLGCCARWEE